MNQTQFKHACTIISDFIVKHKNTTYNTKLNVYPQPGDLTSKLESLKFREKARNFDEIFKHFLNIIYPNTLNWQHPLFLGYFPSCNSYPSILGELLSAGLGTIGLAWKSCPALTELELFCINELINLMQLPFASGNILSSSSESIIISMITAIHSAKTDRSQLVVYASDLAHSCVYKAASILQLKIKNIPVVKKTWQMDTNILKQRICEDLQHSLVPLYVCASFGTTSLCSTDNLEEIGKICHEYNMYMHVDAAYAGSAFFIKKYRKLAKGLHYANSININCNKLMLVNYDCTLALYKDTASLVDALSFDPPYLNSDFNRIDLRNYDISLSRRFRALKLWFTIHSYGTRGIRRFIKKTFRYARILAAMIRKNDSRLEIVNNVNFGLVCFRVPNSNSLTISLFQHLSKFENMYFTSSSIYGISFIRISINNVTSRIHLKEIVNKIIFSADAVMGAQDKAIQSTDNIPLRRQYVNSEQQDKFNSIINSVVNNKIKSVLSNNRRRSISNITQIGNDFVKHFLRDIHNDSW